MQKNIHLVLHRPGIEPYDLISSYFIYYQVFWVEIPGLADGNCAM